MRLTILTLLVASMAAAADWTTVAPVIVGDPVISKVGDRHLIEVRVRFTDDSTPPNTREKVYFVSGAGALTTLQRRTYDDQQTLQSWEGIKDLETITPTAPTPVQQAIADMQEAARKLAALAAMQAALGKADGDQAGTSGVTFAQARAALRNDLTADITNATALGMALENYPVLP